MRRVLLISFLCFLAIVMCGCKKAQLRRQMKELMSSTIVLPERIICVYNGEVLTMSDSVRDKPKLIVYIDSTECTTCRISNFWEYQPVFDLSVQTGMFEVVLLMCNTEFNTIPLVEYLSNQNNRMPIYVDEMRSFLLDNPCIPQDRRMHSFLVDAFGHPVFVGDPSVSGKMMSAFKKALGIRTF